MDLVEPAAAHDAVDAPLVPVRLLEPASKPAGSRSLSNKGKRSRKRDDDQWERPSKISLASTSNDSFICHLAVLALRLPFMNNLTVDRLERRG